MIDIDPTSKIFLYSVLWLGLLLRTLAILSKAPRGSTGLPFAFVMMYTVMHAGALVHLVQGYDHTVDPYLESIHYTRETVADGLEASFLGMLGAVIGFMITGKAMFVHARGHVARYERSQAFAKVVVFIGLSAFVIETISKRLNIELAGLQALLVSARNLCAIGALPIISCLHSAGNRIKVILLTAISATLVPVICLVTSAILADSVSIAIAVFAFYLTLRPASRRPFMRNLFLSGAVVIVSFIFAAFYLHMRTELRELVWNGGSLSEAAKMTLEAAESFDTHSLADNETLASIDSRLDQNIYVGLAIEQLRILPNTYENGDTILLALLGWIPRSIWPDKPVRGGADFVGKHTGKQTEEGVSIGAGPVFEFYVNFAYSGVFFGFVILGSILRILDIQATRALNEGKVPHFVQYELAGFAMLQPLADLFFIVTSVAASLVLGGMLRYFWKRLYSPGLIRNSSP
jgi:hypothetical protein